MKEFCILGLGNFGATVARRLAEAGQRVSAVDSDKNKVQAMQEFVHLAIFGDATDRKFLENLEVKNYDCCVVSTGEDSHASIPSLHVGCDLLLGLAVMRTAPHRLLKLLRLLFPAPMSPSS